jgi:hypothetical protein
MEVAMNVGPYDFEPVGYFPEIDHLRAGGGQIGDSGDERHVFFYSDGGEEPVGIELFGAREQLRREGSITVVLPSGERVRVPEAERIVRESLAAAA